VLWYWLFAGPALLLAAVSLGGERKRAAHVARRLSEAPEYLPPASVIVPVKGEDEGLRENLAAWIWLVGLVASAFGNTVEWRGSKYSLKRGASIIST